MVSSSDSGMGVNGNWLERFEILLFLDITPPFVPVSLPFDSFDDLFVDFITSLVL